MSEFLYKVEEDKLREASCYGDLEAVQSLVRNGVNVNSTNAVNKWTALHWAANRGHYEIVKLLISSGADRNAQAANGKRPIDVVTPDRVRVRELLSQDGESSDSASSKDADNKLNVAAPTFVPEYLKNPPLVYNVTLGERFESGGTPISSGTLSTSVSHGDQTSFEKVGGDVGMVLKVRMHSDSECGDVDEDGDFYEMDFPDHPVSMTFYYLEKSLRKTLSIPDEVRIRKIRKLPNTVIRMDIDVKRLKPFQELEVVLDKSL
ncbi:unnamed protein product [Cyprideis torosa]|uniref:Uncharacterized protein n=1 Tax=Cyprideis torosa TaxID=163714 RepID=A0A7R8ZVK9_9CRUS|nr:unnamed protein product [Cyprideis torosa]CAG0903022.1 unnamed protein product [Cyprideis torosa]